MNKQKLLSRIQGCLAGIIIGDALGMPWEGFSRNEILQITKTQGIIDFSSPEIRKVKDTACLPIGSTTDDWAFTKAVLKSLITNNDFNLIDQSLTQIKALSECSGTGRATKNSLLEIKKYFESLGIEGRSPSLSSPQQENCGKGNGIAMKVAPLPLFLAAKLSSGQIYEFDSPNENIGYNISILRKWVWELGHLTHSWPEASAGAYIIASIIFDILMLEIEWSPDFCQFLLNRTITKLSKFEEEFQTQTEFNDKLLTLSLLLQDPYSLNSETLIGHFGNSVLAIESVMIVLAIFFKNFGKFDFKTSLLEMANFGGDTDTNCSILGGLLGSILGIEKIPEKWRLTTFVQISKAMEYSNQLFLKL